MAHWAELSDSNIVLRVTVGDNNDPAGDEGYSWLVENLGGTWVKTSYNAVGGKRRDPETQEITNDPGFRKNFASIGMIYDPVRDAFYEQQPYFSWTLNEETCLWEAPVPYPDSDDEHVWDEINQTWKLKFA